jgi:hypothetical protein
MDYKILAAMLFRVLGLSYLVYSIFYAPYLLLTASYSGTFIISAFGVLTYVAAGVCLLFLSKPFVGLVGKGLGLNNIPPPPPPRF